MRITRAVDLGSAAFLCQFFIIRQEMLTTCIYRFTLFEVFELVYTGLMIEIKTFFGGARGETISEFRMVAPIYGISGIP